MQKLMENFSHCFDAQRKWMFGEWRNAIPISALAILVSFALCAIELAHQQ
jgi:hypothetical protein